jgi:hypothetical protein
MTSEPRLTFRITPWRPWLLAVTILALPAAAVVALPVAAGELAVAFFSLLGFAAVALILLVPIGWAAGTSRWHVDPKGVGGRDNYHVYHHLDWSEIDSVSPWLIPGYPYLQVNGGSRRRVFWLPLFLTDMPGFRSAVARYAPPGSPLRCYLESYPAERVDAADRPRD